MKKVIALERGYYKGQRVNAGETFKVDDNATGKWFADADKYKPVVKTTFGQASTMGSLAKRESQSFVTAMKKVAVVEAVEPEPESKRVRKSEE